MREHQQASSLLSAREITPQAMERASSAAGVSTAVLLDREGRVLAGAAGQARADRHGPSPQVPASRISRGRTRSGVRCRPISRARALGRWFRRTIPDQFGTACVQRSAYIVSDTPLGAYLSHLLVTPGNRVYLVDANAVVIASNGPLLNGAKTLLEINPVLAARLRTRVERPRIGPTGALRHTSACPSPARRGAWS